MVVPKFSSIEEYDDYKTLDLTVPENCLEVTRGITEVYNLAAMNGSIEVLITNKADLFYNNALINLNMARGCILSKVRRIFFSSSACVYPIGLQSSDQIHLLKEEDAYPANPDSEYGWEKLMSERVWKDYETDYGLEVRIGRYFNIYGTESPIDPAHSKAPVALTRKVIEAGNGGEVKIWGDGDQKRSFCYIDDCVEATYKLMKSNVNFPVNIGIKELMSINELVGMIADIEGIKVKKTHQPTKTQGVRTRHSNLEKAKKLLNWEAKVKTREGLININRFVHKILDS